MAKKNYRRNPKYKGKNLSTVKKGSKVTNQQTIRMRKVQMIVNGHKVSVERPCVVYKYHGQTKVHVLEDWRLAQIISETQAEKYFKSLPKGRQEADKQRESKYLYSKNNIKSSYATKSGVSRSDVEGIDTPEREWSKDWKKAGEIQEQYEKSEIQKKQDVSEGSKDILEGGNADKLPDSDFDPKELAKGTSIEMEHTDEVKIAKEIAKDHLTESPNYYKELEKMESMLEKEKTEVSLKPRYYNQKGEFFEDYVYSIEDRGKTIDNELFLEMKEEGLIWKESELPISWEGGKYGLSPSEAKAKGYKGILYQPRWIVNERGIKKLKQNNYDIQISWE